LIILAPSRLSGRCFFVRKRSAFVEAETGVAAVLMLGMMRVSVSAAGLGKVYHAPFAAPVVDGVMEDAWTTAAWTNVDVPFDGSMDTVCPDDKA